LPEALALVEALIAFAWPLYSSIESSTIFFPSFSPLTITLLTNTMKYAAITTLLIAASAAHGASLPEATPAPALQKRVFPTGSADVASFLATVDPAQLSTYFSWAAHGNAGFTSHAESFISANSAEYASYLSAKSIDAAQASAIAAGLGGSNGLEAAAAGAAGAAGAGAAGAAGANGANSSGSSGTNGASGASGSGSTESGATVTGTTQNPFSTGTSSGAAGANGSSTASGSQTTGASSGTNGASNTVFNIAGSTFVGAVIMAFLGL
jgi:hypothetical protein